MPHSGRSELTAHARFLFGRQIMFPDQADSPARRIYLALQGVYVGSPEERARAMAELRSCVAAFRDATTSSGAGELLDRLTRAAETDECYLALKLARRLMRHEDAVLDRDGP